MIISRRRSPTLPPSQLHLLGDSLQRVECYIYLGLLIRSNMTWSMHISSTCFMAKQILGLLYRQFYDSASSDTYLLGDSLQRVECYIYLGLLIRSNMTWSMHISSTCFMAKQILGLLYRRFYDSASSDTLKQLYLSMFQPHLDYACLIWDPHLAKVKKKLEGVQKFACRLASHRWDASYQELLQLCEQPSLKERRLHLKLGLIFKIIHNLCYYPDTPLFRNNVPSIAAHAMQLKHPFAHTNAYYFFNFPHTM